MLVYPFLPARGPSGRSKWCKVEFVSPPSNLCSCRPFNLWGTTRTGSVSFIRDSRSTTEPVASWVSPEFQRNSGRSFFWTQEGRLKNATPFCYHLRCKSNGSWEQNSPPPTLGKSVPCLLKQLAMGGAMFNHLLARTMWQGQGLEGKQGIPTGRHLFIYFIFLLSPPHLQYGRASIFIYPIRIQSLGASMCPFFLVPETTS